MIQDYIVCRSYLVDTQTSVSWDSFQEPTPFARRVSGNYHLNLPRVNQKEIVIVGMRIICDDTTQRHTVSMQTEGEGKPQACKLTNNQYYTFHQVYANGIGGQNCMVSSRFWKKPFMVSSSFWERINGKNDMVSSLKTWWQNQFLNCIGIKFLWKVTWPRRQGSAPNFKIESLFINTDL